MAATSRFIPESPPGVYPKGRAVLESHGRKCFVGVRLLRGNTTLRCCRDWWNYCFFVSTFLTRFQVSLRQGLCLIHLFPHSAPKVVSISTCWVDLKDWHLLLRWCPLPLGTAAWMRRLGIHAGACEPWCSSMKGSKGPHPSPAAPGNCGLRFFTTTVLPKSWIVGILRVVSFR